MSVFDCDASQQCPAVLEMACWHRTNWGMPGPLPYGMLRYSQGTRKAHPRVPHSYCGAVAHKPVDLMLHAAAGMHPIWCPELLFLVHSCWMARSRRDIMLAAGINKLRQQLALPVVHPVNHKFKGIRGLQSLGTMHEAVPAASLAAPPASIEEQTYTCG